MAIDGSHIFIQENDEPGQELLPVSPTSFFSASSSDDYSIKLDGKGAARFLILHLSNKDVEFRRLD